MISLPPHLLEGSNGAIAFALIFVVLIQFACLSAAYIKIASPVSFYRQMKPVIALTVMGIGFQIRSAPIWWLRFSDHHGIGRGVDLGLNAALHVVGTIMAIVGLLCWLRVTMPRFCGPRTWAVVVVLTGIIFSAPWAVDGALSAWAWILDALPRFRVF